MTFSKPGTAPICKGPNPINRLFELRAPLEWATLSLSAPYLLTAPKGDGRPVVLAPGYMANATSMAPLQLYLNHLGYRCSSWTLGTNRGDVEGDIVRFGDEIEALSSAHDDAPVTLIGWSLGGVVAREVARLNAPSVREVITMGTPIIGGPKYTSVGALFARSQGMDLDDFEQDVHERNSAGLTQPVTSIYSKLDGIVGWRASVDVYNPQARNVEVYASHLGLGGSPRVWRTIADTLHNSGDKSENNN